MDGHQDHIRSRHHGSLHLSRIRHLGRLGLACGDRSWPSRSDGDLDIFAVIPNALLRLSRSQAQGEKCVRWRRNLCRETNPAIKSTIQGLDTVVSDTTVNRCELLRDRTRLTVNQLLDVDSNAQAMAAMLLAGHLVPKQAAADALHVAVAALGGGNTY
jgi:hypothetical protein